MKKDYVSPEIEIIEFEVEDIITASSPTGTGDNVITPPDDWY
jgi:hypothetical protein